MEVISTRKAGEVRDPKLRKLFNAWVQRAREAQWHSFNDVRDIIPHASQVGTCFVFNVLGNRYRLICKIDFQLGRIYLLHLLTHSEYDQDKWKRDCG